MRNTTATILLILGSAMGVIACIIDKSLLMMSVGLWLLGISVFTTRGRKLFSHIVTFEFTKDRLIFSEKNKVTEICYMNIKDINFGYVVNKLSDEFLVEAFKLTIALDKGNVVLYERNERDNTEKIFDDAKLYEVYEILRTYLPRRYGHLVSVGRY